MAVLMLLVHLSFQSPPLVVIDPGHGGEQDGAVGICGVKEKDAVLTVSRRAAKLINQSGNIRAKLTRTQDVDLPLLSRPEMANRAGAMLFVSVHANSSPSPRSRGVETFFLSQKASDRYAANLAARENMAHPISAPKSNNALNHILGQLKHQNNHRRSQHFALQLQQTLANSMNARNRGVLQAPFLVLKSADMPAVLVEIGFLTHEAECPKLGNKEHLDQVAAALAQAIILEVGAIQGHGHASLK